MPLRVLRWEGIYVMSYGEKIRELENIRNYVILSKQYLSGWSWNNCNLFFTPLYIISANYIDRGAPVWLLYYVWNIEPTVTFEVWPKWKFYIFFELSLHKLLLDYAYVVVWAVSETRNLINQGIPLKCQYLLRNRVQSTYSSRIWSWKTIEEHSRPSTSSSLHRPTARRLFTIIFLLTALPRRLESSNLHLSINYIRLTEYCFILLLNWR